MLVLDHVRDVIRVLRWRTVLVVLLLALGGVLEGFGILMLIPLLGAVGLDLQQGAIGRLSSTVLDTFARFHVAPTLPLILAVFLIINVGLAASKMGQAVFGAALEREIVTERKRRLYDSIIHMEWLAFTRLRAGDLTSALTVECDRIGIAASRLIAITATGIVSAVYIGMAFRIAPKIAGLVFGSAALLLLVLRRRNERGNALGRAFSAASADLYSAVGDDLAGMKTIRSFVAERQSLARFMAAVDHAASVHRVTIFNWASSAFWLEVGSVGMLSVLVLVAVLVFHLDAAGLLLLLFLFARIVPRVTGLQQNAQYYVNALPSLANAETLEKKCREAAEPRTTSTRTIRPERTVALDHVTFRYDTERRDSLTDASLTLRVGQTTAIVGPSGAGKTTVVDVLLGLLKPAAGRLMADDVALGPGDMADWRKGLAYVPQDTFLFHDTIRANLLWAEPAATEHDIAEALAIASADFVLEWPAGLDTIVGDRGMRLSGGERQRIALARAVLKKPWFLVLDEATSALDGENEARIFEAVQRLHGRMTIVIVTHRLSALAIADAIVTLDAGRVVDRSESITGAH